MSGPVFHVDHIDQNCVLVSGPLHYIFFFLYIQFLRSCFSDSELIVYKVLICLILDPGNVIFDLVYMHEEGLLVFITHLKL